MNVFCEGITLGDGSTVIGTVIGGGAESVRIGEAVLIEFDTVTRVELCDL